MSRTNATANTLASRHWPRVSSEQIVSANGVQLCAQTFGDAHDPAMLLIHGAATSMQGWDEAFCRRLAAGGRFVIRYDHRDTGQSVSYPPGQPPYALRDLASDALGLLDAYKVESAHLLGRSMGAGIAMLAALDAPARVESLTLIGASPGGDDLPPMSVEFLAYIRQPAPDWTDLDAATEHVLGLLRIFAGASGHLREEPLREQIRREWDRTRNVASSQINHFAMDTGAPIRERLGAISAPTLVIHGDRDPVFPLGHAHALVSSIPRARLLVLEETAHELPRAEWDTVIPALLAHTSRHAGSSRRVA
ncbi:MAG: alpha/beta hydrolase [Thermomicrobiales bacterium]